MVSNGQIKNRCPECRSWNGTVCKYGIDGQFKCDRWGYDYARLMPSALGNCPAVEINTDHREKLYGGN